jgi:hypothetical protein
MAKNTSGKQFLRIEVRPGNCTGGDNDIDMDGGPVKDEDMNSRGQPVLTTGKFGQTAA